MHSTWPISLNTKVINSKLTHLGKTFKFNSLGGSTTHKSAAQKKKEGNPKKDFDRIEEIEMSNEKS